MKKGFIIALLIMASLIIQSQNDDIHDRRSGSTGPEANVEASYRVADNGDAFSAGGNSYSGAVHCNPWGTEVVDVTNSFSGAVWMDRNLGAYRQATYRADSLGFGDLYQWGRFADGHQCRNSNTTTTQSPDDTPGHGDFIVGSKDWRSTHNDSLWQGMEGFNNPCPPGYRVPTLAEWVTEIESWILENATGAYGSPLKIPLAGMRNGTSGAVENEGSWAGYWSSTSDHPNFLPGESFALAFDNSFFRPRDLSRSNGYAVRCIKDVTVGVSYMRNSMKVKLFPNPATEYIHFDLSALKHPRDFKLTIYNTNGQTVKKLTIDNAQYQVNLQHLPQGVYLYRLQQQNGREVYQGRFIKK